MRKLCHSWVFLLFSQEGFFFNHFDVKGTGWVPWTVS